jgi:hypothetical protein
MALIVPEEGEMRLLDYIVNKTSATDVVLHLYTNSVSLGTKTFNTSSFTEATATGYAAETLTGSNWLATSSAGVGTSLYNAGITFGFSIGQNIQGYYVTDLSNNILWAEEFPGAPFQLPTGGGDVAVRPQLQLS